MELTRRDALAALAAGGAAAGAGAVLSVGDGLVEAPTHAEPESSTREPALDGHERDVMVAVARVLYPSAVSGIGEFVRAYLDGRTDPEYVSGAGEAVATLDDLGEEWHGGRFLDLDAGTREELLREVGADTAEPDPGGSPAERVRYYLVNELLFALYASPTGGELVGVENPQGHPGGLSSYQRGPRG
jgi:hypothetical protein